MMRVILVVLVVLSARIANATPEEAAAESQRAKTLYAAGDFAAAADAFHKAYELDPKSEYLFGKAQALRKGGDCPAALALYEKLLAMPLDEVERAATRQAMARCEAKPAPSSPAPAPVIADDRAWYRDWRAGVLVGVGVVGIGAGTWMTVQSVADERDARSAMTYGEHERLGDRATILRVVGISAHALGAVSGAIGIYRYATAGQRRTVSAYAGGTGAGIAIGGTW